ncbi:MAG: glycosyltransferase family 39 protein [Bryobacteraceae bacterium]|nr:glycosyltransferase family 39 protein [Bryobacteraceae bacterium]
MRALQARRSGWSPWIGVAALPVATFLVFAPALRCGFVNLDDPLYVTRNEWIQRGLTLDTIRRAAASVSEMYWHPLTWLSHAMDCELFGLNPAGHHFTSVLLHAVNAALAYLLLRRLTSAAWASFAGALLFAAHPLRVESVAWVAERKDVLAGCFSILTVLTYGWYTRSPGWKRYAAVAAVFACALMSKPSTVIVPALLLLFDYWPLRRSGPALRLIAEKAPLFVLSGVVAALTIAGQESAGALDLVPSLTISARLGNAAVSCARYLYMTVWPADLGCHYPYRVPLPMAEVAASVALLGVLTAAAVQQRKTRPYLFVGWFWFLAALLPMAGIIQAGRQAYADRFTYIPSIGLIIAATGAGSEFAAAGPRRRHIAAVAAAVAGAAFMILTPRQATTWRDSITLFEHGIAVSGPNEYQRGNLATSLMEEGRYAEAEPHLVEAARIAPHHFHHHQNLAYARLRMGQPGRAAESAAVAVQLAPERPGPHHLQARIRLLEGKYDDAIAELDEAVRLGLDRSRAAATANDHGASLARQGRFAEAETLLRAATRWNPELDQAQRNLALALLDQGKREEAMWQLRRALAVGGGGAEVRQLAAELGVGRWDGYAQGRE